MALSDFMPYGAPELLDGASQRMARSTLTASGVVAIMVWCLGVIATHRSTVHELLPQVMPQYLFQPELYQPEKPAGPAPAIHTFTKPEGEIHPVADEPPVLPEFDEPPPVGPVTPGRIGEPDVVGGANVVCRTPNPDPLPDEFVYTDELPQLVRGVKPVYPDLAREAGVEGTVKLQLLIGLDGRVLRALVRPGGSVPMLDETAIAAALQCVFTPALANGRPVKVWVTQDYRFKLH